jgi:heat shock protein HtpX
MQIAKRVLLFLATNFLVITTISIVMQLLGVGHYLTAHGIDYMALLVLCTLWGFGGAFISLLLSKWMAKMAAGVQVIDPETRDPEARWLITTVHRLAQQAGIEEMPEVGVYDSPEVNAFATGPTRNNALVAVSTGLLERMDRGAVEGVLGHEVAHVANGDMVTMTLVQGVINAFVMFAARVIAFLVTQNSRSENRYLLQSVITMLLQIALSFLGMMVVAAFSRWREYRADAGGASLAGKSKMILALEALREVSRRRMPQEAHASLATLKISGTRGGFAALFSTHPDLEDRIARLRSAPVAGGAFRD